MCVCEAKPVCVCNQVLGFERDEDPSILVLSVQCETGGDMYHSKDECLRPIVAQVTVASEHSL